MLGSLGEGDAVALFFPVETPFIAGSCVLSPLEIEREKRFTRSADRLAFRGARTVVREVLSTCCGIPAKDVPLQTTDKGKPFCPDGRAPFFNVSHSAGWIAVGFCHHGEIGVDIESLDRPPPPSALVERWFRGQEKERMKDTGEFVREWTRKEAWVKATGLGLATAAGKADTHALEREGVWRFTPLQPAPGLFCHVVTRSASVRSWVWISEGQGRPHEWVAGYCV